MALRVLDLFSGAGGAATGYYEAGFDVTGVDIIEQLNYPFAHIVGDALEYVREHSHEYDVIHASPPCQAYSWAGRRWKKEWPDMVGATREALAASGLPYIIENVPGAPLLSPVVLCGEMFGLGVIRHRLFESNMLLSAPAHLPHRGLVRDGHYVTVAGHGGDGRAALHLWREGMGISWMTKQELTQAIPPAYTRYLAEQLRWHLEGAA